jgi:DNA-binding transcriptional LysR family regulator
VDAGGRTNTIRAAGAVRSNDAAFLRAAALAGGGIALLPSHAAAGDVASGRLVRVLGDRIIPGGKLFFVHRPGPFVSPQLAAFRDFVVEALRPAVGPAHVSAAIR